MSTAKVGDRVKVGYEGTVTSSLPYSQLVRIKREDGRYASVSAEYVTVIEPAYETQAVYVDDTGVFYLRGHDFWIFCATGQEHDHEYPVRPLRKMVPEADFAEVAARL